MTSEVIDGQLFPYKSTISAKYLRSNLVKAFLKC